MTVNEILQEILQLAHHENSPNTQMLEKALGWLNAAYNELLDELGPFQAEQSPSLQCITTNAEGQAQLNAPVRKIEQIVNATGQALQPISLVAVAAWQDGQNNQTLPAYNLQNQTLSIFPPQATSLKVFYLPQIVDLQRTDGTDAILVPPEHHKALVWGGLVWASVYERGFSAAQDMRLFEQKWLAAKQQIKLSMLAKPQAALRTAVYSNIV